MSDENKPYDPFKPAQPTIPGVPTETGPGGKATGGFSLAFLKLRLSQMQMPPAWLTIAIVAAIVAGIGIAWWSRDPAVVEPGPAPIQASAPLAAEPAAPAEQLPTAPGEIATTDELAREWSSKRFVYRTSTGEQTPAIVVRVPGGNFWAILLREPFGTCELEYVTDLPRLEKQYHYRADHPMVGDPCHHTVFDLTRYGTNSAGGLVRGQVVHGAAIRPPIAIEIRTNGRQVIADRME